MNRARASLIAICVGFLPISCAGEAETPTDESAAGTSGTGASPPLGSLLAGDSTLCPPAPSPDRPCGDTESACTYAGGQFGLSTIIDPITCFCADEGNVWVCVETDAEGRTECPIVAQPHGASCSPQGLECNYGQAIRVAACGCTARGDGTFTFECFL